MAGGLGGADSSMLVLAQHINTDVNSLYSITNCLVKTGELYLVNPFFHEV